MNLDDAWNYILGGIDLVGLVALRAVGKKKAIGWLWAMFTQIVWVIYSIATFQWGFLVPAVIKLAIYTWNYVSWLREDRAGARPKSHEERALDWAKELIPDADELTRARAASFLVKAIRCVELYPQKVSESGASPVIPPHRSLRPPTGAGAAD